jgi:hypothetical protein
MKIKLNDNAGCVIVTLLICITIIILSLIGK